MRYVLVSNATFLSNEQAAGAASRFSGLSTWSIAHGLTGGEFLSLVALDSSIAYYFLFLLVSAIANTTCWIIFPVRCSGSIVLRIQSANTRYAILCLHPLLPRTCTCPRYVVAMDSFTDYTPE